MESVDHNKYITFKREEFTELFGQHNLEHAAPIELVDAVVIRRQDLFAGPALHSYAASIAIAAKLSDSTNGLQQIADYFHEQALLADEQGWKLPDL